MKENKQNLKNICDKMTTKIDIKTIKKLRQKGEYIKAQKLLNIHHTNIKKGFKNVRKKQKSNNERIRYAKRKMHNEVKKWKMEKNI